MKTLTVYNSKGGVAKSTLAALIAEWFASQGDRVVVVDLDRQGSQSEIFDLIGPDGRPDEALHLVLKRQVHVLAALTPVAAERLPQGTAARGGEVWVLQGGLRSSEAFDEIVANPVRYRLANTVELVRQPLQELAAWRDGNGRGWVALWYAGSQLAVLDDSPACWEILIEREVTQAAT